MSQNLKTKPTTPTLSVKQTATALGISEKEVLQLIVTRQLPFIRVGGKRRIRISDIETFAGLEVSTDFTPEAIKQRSINAVLKTVKVEIDRLLFHRPATDEWLHSVLEPARKMCSCLQIILRTEGNEPQTDVICEVLESARQLFDATLEAKKESSAA